MIEQARSLKSDTNEGNNSWSLKKSTDYSQTKSLRLAICMPEFLPLQQAMGGGPADAAYIQQGYIVSGLQGKGHSLTFISPYDLDMMVCTKDIQEFNLAPKTWSGSRWFDVTARGTWKVQQWFRVPYMNVFSNYCRLDGYLHCLPGHDLVYERNSLYNSGVAMACRRLNIPYVLFFDADQILELDYLGTPITGLQRVRAQRLLRFNLAAADCIICVSKQAKDHLIGNLEAPEDKIALFPNGTDVERFQPDHGRGMETRASFGFGDKSLLVFVGSFYKWHDLTTLLDAFAILTAEHPEARLILVGDGDQRSAMEEYASKLGLGQAVHYTGLIAHSDVPRILAAADMAVAPYPPMDNDLWLSPLKLFEYMASGTAIVASDIGQVSEIIDDRRNGLLVPPGDAAAMAGALKQLIDDPGLRSRLGEAAREDALRRHSWEHYIARLEQVFSAVIAGNNIQGL